MSEYHKIETLYERNPETFKVLPGVLKNRTYGLLKSWVWTEKIDGTNIRVIWNPFVAQCGHIISAKDQALCQSCGAKIDELLAGKLRFGGKTDNAQIHADLIRYLYETISPESLRAIFPENDAVLYGEGYGAGIQKGGGYSPTKKFILFDVLVDGEWWLSDENMRDVASKLHVDAVPIVGDMTLEDATALVQVGFISALGDIPAEGLVGRPAEALFDKKGHRLIVKLKTKDF
jgi:hypothetical protein